MIDWTPIIFGFLGGISTEVLVLYKVRDKTGDQFPKHLKTYNYWLNSLVMAVVGGVFVYAYSYDRQKFGLLLAMNIGASAPCLIGTLTKKHPSFSE